VLRFCSRSDPSWTRPKIDKATGSEVKKEEGSFIAVVAAVSSVDSQSPDYSSHHHAAYAVYPAASPHAVFVGEVRIRKKKIGGQTDTIGRH
jgi:hypothetical protein